MGAILIKAILQVIKFILSVLLIPLVIVAVFFCIYGICVVAQLFREHRKGNKIVKLYRNIVKEHSFWRKLFIDAPAMYCYDLTHRDPYEFGYQGFILFTGRQGYGKTIGATQAIRFMQQEFPSAKVMTNYAYSYEDNQLSHWSQLIDYKNGRKGVIIGMDEVQNWFSSKQSMNFPPEMLEVITQNRKNKRIIVGTSQNFSSIAKDLRKQVTEVRECITLFGCITIVKKKIAELNSDGDVEEWHNRGYYWFVHDLDLRSCYDTYKVIESLAKSGFKAKADKLE